LKLFYRELYNKSILDIGCGKGEFLKVISESIPTKKLVGIDTSVSALPKDNLTIEFINSDIINFNFNETFDVIFSDNVFEHIAPIDVSSHLRSIYQSLKNKGKLIIIMPNRLFGPSDVTRIIDYTYSNKIPALGTHLNESTYSDMLAILKESNFKNFKSLIPGPKLKYIFPQMRIDAKLLKFIESLPLVIKALHKIKYDGKCVFKLDIILICSK
jgi:SAM-dependent methyltransferase